MASSACSRSRWRSRRGRRCCCSTSRRPACRARKARNCSRRSPACPRDITVLFIEHDMELVFRFARRVIVMVGGRVLIEGTPQEIAADPRVREVYLGKARSAAWLTAARARRPARRLRRRRRARRHVARVAGARQPRGARPQRRRQDDAAAHHHGLHADRAAAASSGAARTSRGWPPHRRALARHRLGRAGARDFPVADGRGESDGGGARRTLGPAARLRALSAARRAAAQYRQPALRRRAADAGDRARADDQSGAAAARRAAGRSGADHRRGTRRRDPAHDERRQPWPSSWSSSTPSSRCR